MNIAKLDGPGVKILIEEIISEGDERSEMKQSDQAWINIFWSEFPMLKLENKALDYVSSFPLVPTMEPGKYISISRCKNRSAVVFSTPDEPPLLWKFLTELGTTVVPRHSGRLPGALADILRPSSNTYPRTSASDNFPHFKFDHVLLALKAIESSVPRRFEALSVPSRRGFAEWACQKVSSIPTNLRPIARTLPIWPPIHSHLDEQSQFFPASSVTMLPDGISRDMAMSFINISVTEYSAPLVHLGVKPLS
jgi:sacsin